MKTYTRHWNGTDWVNVDRTNPVPDFTPEQKARIHRAATGAALHPHTEYVPEYGHSVAVSADETRFVSLTEAGYFRGVPDDFLRMILDRVAGSPASQREVVRMLRGAPAIEEAVGLWIAQGYDYAGCPASELRARWESISRQLV
jgi:hypothetical protein